MFYRTYTVRVTARNAPLKAWQSARENFVRYFERSVQNIFIDNEKMQGIGSKGRKGDVSTH